MGYSVICYNQKSVRTLVLKARNVERVFSNFNNQHRAFASGCIRYDESDGKTAQKKAKFNRKIVEKDTIDKEEVVTVDYLSTYKDLSLATKWEAKHTDLNVDPTVKGKKNKSFKDIDNVFGLGDVKSPRSKNQNPIRIKYEKPKKSATASKNPDPFSFTSNKKPFEPKSSQKFMKQVKNAFDKRQFSTSLRRFQDTTQNKLNFLEETDFINDFMKEDETQFKERCDSRERRTFTDTNTSRHIRKPFETRVEEFGKQRINTNEYIQKQDPDSFSIDDIEYFAKESKETFRIDHGNTRDLRDVVKEIIKEDFLGNFEGEEPKILNPIDPELVVESELAEVFQPSKLTEQTSTEEKEPSVDLPPELITPRPEHPRIFTGTKKVKLRAFDGWSHPKEYNSAFIDRFINNPVFKRIQSRNLGILDTSKIVSPIDITLSSEAEKHKNKEMLKNAYGDGFEIENDYVTISSSLTNDLYPENFEKGDVVIMADDANVGERAIVISSTKNEHFKNAIKFGMSTTQREDSDTIVLRMRYPLIDPMKPYDTSKSDQKNAERFIPRTFGGRLEDVNSKFLIKTGKRVDFKFLDNPKIFDCFIDPIERPFVEEEFIIPEMKKTFEEGKYLFLYAGTGRSSYILPERV